MSRPRIVAPVLLLAATLGTASAGPTTDAEGYPVVGNAISKSPRKPAQPSPQVREAVNKLERTSPERVRADIKPFLVLCDTAGYPVVGNAMQASKAARLEVSDVCKIVREQRAAERTKTAKTTRTASRK